MSTRANILIKDKYDELWFYRHHDGYPDGVLPVIYKYIKLVMDGKLRDNVGQSAGWLIIFGNQEYQIDNENITDWKVGAIEPTTQQHGDIDYLYTINLDERTFEISGYPKQSFDEINFDI